VPIPARIEAEDYVRYLDTTAGNTGGGCDSGDDVDKEPTTDPENGICNVGWTEPGEWLEYDITVAETREFDIILRLAAEQPGKTCRVEIDGVNVSGAIQAPAQGWQTFEDRTVRDVTITEGNHVVRIYMETGLLNINYLVFAMAATADSNLGAEHVETQMTVDGNLTLLIDQWSDWGSWTPSNIVVGFRPVDGAPMDGMSASVASQTTPLSGWWQTLNTPYTHQTEIQIDVNAPSERVIVVQWWAE
jgi:hypothetical protein